MSELLILLKENDSGLLSLLLINNMLGWCLHLLIAFIMGSVMSLGSSMIYGLSFVYRLLVAFLKRLFSSSDIKFSSDIIFSFSSTWAILVLIFLFFENKGWIFFQKLCYQRLSLDLFCQNMLCAPFYITYYNVFCASYISLKSLVFTSQSTIFLSMIFS